MYTWPKDVTLAKNAFYGDFLKKGWQDLNLMHMFPPFPMYYEGEILKHGIAVHRRIMPALSTIFEEVWNACDRDHDKINATGISDFGGCFNIRRIAGSNNWSNHSWACAIDLSPGTNGYNMKTTLAEMVIGAFKRQGARWGGDYHGRKDPMHFEFVSPA